MKLPALTAQQQQQLVNRLRLAVPGWVATWFLCHNSRRCTLMQAAHAAAPAPSAEGGLGAGAAAAAAAAAAGPGGAEAKQEPGVEPVEAKQEELGQAQGEAVAGPAERPEGGLTLDELLQPGPWTKATIRGEITRLCLGVLEVGCAGLDGA